MKTNLADPKSHWEGIYGSKVPTEVSWYQSKPTYSLAMITHAAPQRDAHILDVGSGATTLLAELLDCGYTHITAVDISSAALERSRQQLGIRASQIQWLEADVRDLPLPPSSVDVWHDRAVYHFLTRTSDR